MAKKKQKVISGNDYVRDYYQRLIDSNFPVLKSNFLAKVKLPPELDKRKLNNMK